MRNFEEKSYVGMAHHVCPVCLKEHDPVVLLNTRMAKTLTRHEFAGWAMCEEHQKLKDEGYVALIAVSDQGSMVTLENANRTGHTAHVRQAVWAHIFNVPLSDKGLAFVSPEIITYLQKLTQQDEDAII